MFLTCDLLGVEYEIKEVDPIKGESKTPGRQIVTVHKFLKKHLKDIFEITCLSDFLAINPQHKVPVYKEGDFILTES